MALLKLEDKITLFYKLLEGHPGLPYLVFLHEGLGCTDMWHNFPARLCKITGCPGLCYDRLGYGKSSSSNKERTIHYLHDSALIELPAILNSVIPDRTYILIGHSDGGSISLIFAAERSPQLKAVITEAAHIFVDSETIAGITSARTAWSKGKMQGLAQYHGDKTDAVFHAWSDTWLSPWFRHWNIEYLLPSVDVPLLVIQGNDDQYGSSNQYNLIKAKTAGPADLKILSNCCHIPHLEAQSEVLKVMADFITAIVAEVRD